MKINRLSIILLSFFLLSSCQKEEEEGLNKQFEFMYGDWHVESIYSMSIPPEAIFEKLRLSYPSDYSVLVRDSIVDAGNFAFWIENSDDLNLEFNSTDRIENYLPPPRLHNTAIRVVTYNIDSIQIYNRVYDFGHFTATLTKCH